MVEQSLEQPAYWDDGPHMARKVEVDGVWHVVVVPVEQGMSMGQVELRNLVSKPSSGVNLVFFDSNSPVYF